MGRTVSINVNDVGMDNRIAHIVFSEDLFLNREIKNNAYTSALKNILISSINNNVEGDVITYHEKIIPNDIDKLLCKLIEMNYEYAVCWFEGSVCSDDIDEEIIKWGKLRTRDWNMMGHILERGNRLQLHQQTVIFNLKNYIPYDDNVGSNWTYKSSGEHMHDDYTPTWVKGVVGKNSLDTEIGDGVEHVFDLMFHNTLAQQGKVVNVPYKIRDCKQCFYVDDDQDETVEWMYSDDFLSLNIPAIKDKKKSIDSDKHDLAYYYVHTDAVYVTNTDEILDTAEAQYWPDDIEVMICPAAGLNQFLYALHFKNTIQKIIWTDFSSPAIDWLKFILNNWNGKNFDSFYYNNKHRFEEEWNSKEDLLKVNKNKLKELTEIFNNISSEDWNNIVNLEHVFLNIDIIKDYEQILPHVVNKNVFFQFTNIYSYEVNYLLNKYHKVQLSFYSLMYHLIENNENVYGRGESPSGILYPMTNFSRLGRF